MLPVNLSHDAWFANMFVLGDNLILESAALGICSTCADVQQVVQLVETEIKNHLHENFFDTDGCTLIIIRSMSPSLIHTMTVDGLHSS